ncbi:MAG: hypothetical protein H0U63_05480 [Burkholderiales bacterium]|nr:hypothetical protein [Burkholderiales bacterium]
MKSLFICIALVAASSVAARNLPPEGSQADLAALEYPFVKLAGKPVRLAPGALIYDDANRVIPPNTLPAKAKVLYKLDIRGDVQYIWLLTGEEIALLKEQKKTQ